MTIKYIPKGTGDHEKVGGDDDFAGKLHFAEKVNSGSMDWKDYKDFRETPEPTEPTQKGAAGQSAVVGLAGGPN